MRRLPKAPEGYSVYKGRHCVGSLLFLISRNSEPSAYHAITYSVHRKGDAIYAVGLFFKTIDKPKHLSMAQFVFMLCALDRVEGNR